eukprot:53733-Eustigmatos_ZCMA.PRE.1
MALRLGTGCAGAGSSDARVGPFRREGLSGKEGCDGFTAGSAAAARCVRHDGDISTAGDGLLRWRSSSIDGGDCGAAGSTTFTFGNS